MLLLQEGRAARVRWLLDGRRRRERAALWRTLRELLPEHVLEGLGRGAEMEAHVKQVVVLQAEVEAGEGAGEGDMALAATEGLHELLTLWDQEVLVPSMVSFHPPPPSTTVISPSLHLSLYLSHFEFHPLSHCECARGACTHTHERS